MNTNEQGQIEPFQVYARLRKLLDKEVNPYNVKRKDFIEIDSNQVISYSI